MDPVCHPMCMPAQLIKDPPPRLLFSLLSLSLDFFVLLSTHNDYSFDLLLLLLQFLKGFTSFFHVKSLNINSTKIYFGFCSTPKHGDWHILMKTRIRRKKM